MKLKYYRRPEDYIVEGISQRINRMILEELMRQPQWQHLRESIR